MIVMLTSIVEAGKVTNDSIYSPPPSHVTLSNQIARQVKCCRYWPDKGSSIEYGPFEILSEVERSDDLCTTRHLMLRNNKVLEGKGWDQTYY